MPAPVHDSGSFRDPASRIVFDGERVLRLLSDRGHADWRQVAKSKVLTDAMASGQIVDTKEVSIDGRTALEHRRIAIWSYPYEWTFSMLKRAALLHLDLLESALKEDITLKDATPYNIVFEGTRPVFVDVGSFRPLESGEPWLGYRQFCQLFLYPLLITAHTGVPFQPLLRADLAGIAPATARALLARHRRRPGVLTDVMLQARLDRSTSRGDVRSELGQAGFKKEIILANVSRLRKVIGKTEWDASTSTWSEYANCDHVSTQRRPKEVFVRAVVAKKPRKLVWDLGANDGYFSMAVSEHAEHVVAVDGDALVMDRLFRRLVAEERSNVTPITMDLSNPSPGLGWRGAERRRLEDRGRPDLTLLLAVVHHLVIGSNLPLTEVMDWLASIGGEVVFEWVPPEDPMARKVAINKRGWEIHADYTEESCRRLIAERFVVEHEQLLDGRILFHLVPKTSPLPT